MGDIGQESQDLAERIKTLERDLSFWRDEADELTQICGEKDKSIKALEQSIMVLQSDVSILKDQLIKAQSKLIVANEKLEAMMAVNVG